MVDKLTKIIDKLTKLDNEIGDNYLQAHYPKEISLINTLVSMVYQEEMGFGGEQEDTQNEAE